MFTYEEGCVISIITKVNRKDEGIANNEKGTCVFWVDDVYRDGCRHDDLQFI
jgi:hypothetical protein